MSRDRLDLAKLSILLYGFRNDADHEGYEGVTWSKDSHFWEKDAEHHIIDTNYQSCSPERYAKESKNAMNKSTRNLMRCAETLIEHRIPLSLFKYPKYDYVVDPVYDSFSNRKNLKLLYYQISTSGRDKDPSSKEGESFWCNRVYPVAVIKNGRIIVGYYNCFDYSAFLCYPGFLDYLFQNQAALEFADLLRKRRIPFNEEPDRKRMKESLEILIKRYNSELREVKNFKALYLNLHK